MQEYQNFYIHKMGLLVPCSIHSEKVRKVDIGVLRKHLGEIYHELAAHNEAKIVEVHIISDHMRMCISRQNMRYRT